MMFFCLLLFKESEETAQNKSQAQQSKSLISALWRRKQDLREFTATLVYIASSRTEEIYIQNKNGEGRKGRRGEGREGKRKRNRGKKKKKKKGKQLLITNTVNPQERMFKQTNKQKQ